MKANVKTSLWGLICFNIVSLGWLCSVPTRVRQRRNPERTEDTGGGTIGTALGQVLAWVILIWGTWVHLTIAIFISTVLGLICIGPGEEYLRQWTLRKTGKTYRINHQCKQVTSDFNWEGIDEFAYILLANAPWFVLGLPWWALLILGVITFILFRLLDGKRKRGLAQWADQNVKGAKGVMLDDLFVGLQVMFINTCIVSLVLGFYYQNYGGALLWFSLLGLPGILSFVLPKSLDDIRTILRGK